MTMNYKGAILFVPQVDKSDKRNHFETYYITKVCSDEENLR